MRMMAYVSPWIRLILYINANTVDNITTNDCDLHHKYGRRRVPPLRLMAPSSTSRTAAATASRMA